MAKDDIFRAPRTGGPNTRGLSKSISPPLILQGCRPSGLSKIRFVCVQIREIHTVPNYQATPQIREIHTVPNYLIASMILAVPQHEVGSKFDNPVQRVTINTRGSSVKTSGWGIDSYVVQTINIRAIKVCGNLADG